MKLSEICIKRPVFATVLSLILVVVGIMGFSKLDTRFFPKFASNSVMITATYPGASAKLIESNITTPIENAVSGIQGIDYMESSSNQGMTTITIKLKDGTPLYQTANKIRNKISMASWQLPNNLKPPVVQAGWGTMDLLDIGFTSNKRSPTALRDYIQRYVINQIQEVDGVANTDINGASPYALRITLKPQLMAARHLSIRDIQDAISDNNVELPAGEITTHVLNYPITAQTQLHSAAAFGNIILRNTNGHEIRLKDVADLALGQEVGSKSLVKVNGRPGVVVTVYSGTDANPITTADKVTKLLKNIQSQLPSDIHLTTVYNQSTYMKSSIREVYISIAIAVACVIAVIFFFLGRLRTVTIPVITIPICVLCSFGLMWMMGFTINVITLLAIVLSIGLVVDDAIVMLENIYRQIELGLKPKLAAIKGSNQITFAVIAMTLTLAAVYAPVGLVSGQAANLFRSFAFTLAGAVIISGFVALTLSPMMCSKLLTSSAKPSAFETKINAIFSGLNHGYSRLLNFVLRHRLSVVVITLAIASGGFFVFKSISKAFTPPEDMGFVVTAINSPSNANIRYLEQQADSVSQVVSAQAAIANNMMMISEGAGGFNSIFSTLKPYSQRKISSFSLAKTINKKLQSSPIYNASTFSPSFGGSMQHSLQFYVMGSGSYQQLYQVIKQIKTRLKHVPGLINLQTDMKFNSQQYALTVNRELAGKLHVSVQAIDSTIAALLGGSSAGTFNLAGRSYQIYLQAPQAMLGSLNSLNQFTVPNASGNLIPLSNLVTVTPTLGQQSLSHYNRLRAAVVSAQLEPGHKLGAIVNQLQSMLPNVLPGNYKYAFTGSAKQLLDSNSSMGLIFLLAIVFIYLVLSAQFESFLDPLIILLAVPLSIVGALTALKLINGSINIYTAIGLVTLIGLVAKHGILITHFANELKRSGEDPIESLKKAATIRLRPILMTTAAMIFGAIPLVIATGASAVSRQQIGTVIIAGLFFGTFFSLVLVPVMYSYMTQLKQRVSKS